MRTTGFLEEVGGGGAGGRGEYDDDGRCERNAPGGRESLRCCRRALGVNL